VWTVIYDIDPVEGGPETYNLEVDIDDGSYSHQDITAQTEDCDDEPLATVTNVLDNKQHTAAGAVHIG
jgi:hypothetical protein